MVSAKNGTGWRPHSRCSPALQVSVSAICSIANALQANFAIPEWLTGVVLVVLVGATLKHGFVWLLADTLNALMAIPNLIALALLSPIIFKITEEFFDSRGKSEDNPF